VLFASIERRCWSGCEQRAAKEGQAAVSSEVLATAQENLSRGCQLIPISWPCLSWSHSHYTIRKVSGEGDTMLTEPRATGCQSVVPHSTRLDALEPGRLQKCGRPAHVAMSELTRPTIKIALGAFVARFWKDSSARHKVCTVYTWAHRRQILSQKVGKLLRFSPTALQRWLRDQERKPLEDLGR